MHILCSVTPLCYDSVILLPGMLCVPVRFFVFVVSVDNIRQSFIRRWNIVLVYLLISVTPVSSHRNTLDGMLFVPVR